ncbi:prolipoprotein diacylglyceryl transferase [Anaeromyxobacter oryzae]|uniref:Phosphatidylglycerol--prolipoprotein diacylglyceryl transferase n=1 Tax=Anaeromyxobacter oryzae TaxID=2918170 RepID=A0ABN6MRE5_9BACT|nr:prolipoprotein diacylglyceryl transferase [Anaeromyxobacter oryzae]BDG03531.1 prolipoprotein diacylglyceryl transferase [Anaeromyxobacter oryzae]
MLPVLFRIVIPAGFGKPALVFVALAVVLARAVGYVRRSARDGEKVSFREALKGDAWVIGGLVVLAAALFRSGLLDGEIRLPVHAYGLLIATGFLAGIFLAQREARRRGQDGERIADLAFWILVAALVGSRVYFILVNFDDYFGPGRFLAVTPFGRMPRFLAVWEGGLVFYGGFIGAALTAFLYMRRHRMPFLAHADTLIPSVAIGHFFGRLGCFCAGCCWGGVAHGHLPWAARFPPESLAYQTFAARAHPADFLAPGGATTLPLHPTQLYESFGELGLFLLLVLLVRPRKRFHGQVLASWLLLYAVLRWTVETFRGDVERGVWLGLGAGQWTSLVIFAVGAALWAGLRRRQASLAPAGAV